MDTNAKFKKFSNEDWIWMYKNFSDMDQELKNQYPLTSDKEILAVLPQKVLLSLHSNKNRLELFSRLFEESPA